MAPLPANMQVPERSTPIDFGAIQLVALGVLPAILGRLLPGGRVQGGEYVVRNPLRRDNRPGSFKIRIAGRRAGVWADFATGDAGGDIISLVAYVDGVSQYEAARRLARLLGIPERSH